MSEMVERVAAAIYNNWANYPACSVSKSWEDICEKLPAQASDFRRKARAAIETMRTMDQPMVDAAYRLMEEDEINFSRLYGHRVIRGIWRCAIDAALGRGGASG